MILDPVDSVILIGRASSSRLSSTSDATQGAPLSILRKVFNESDAITAPCEPSRPCRSFGSVAYFGMMFKDSSTFQRSLDRALAHVELLA